MFQRPHHQAIEAVLRALDAGLLREHACLFGGGTAIVLRSGEFRESLDVDFLISGLDEYRALRRYVGNGGGVGALLKSPADGLVQPVRDTRADQYGIRTRLGLAGLEIKFEIVFEARIDLDPAKRSGWICGVPTLTPADMVATKLLANVDRWADAGVFARDVIDLALMQPTPAERAGGLAKAQGAYGDAVLKALLRAVERLETNPDWMRRCIEALQINLPPAALWQHLRQLKRWES